MANVAMDLVAKFRGDGDLKYIEILHAPEIIRVSWKLIADFSDEVTVSNGVFDFSGQVRYRIIGAEKLYAVMSRIPGSECPL